MMQKYFDRALGAMCRPLSKTKIISQFSTSESLSSVSSLRDKVLSRSSALFSSAQNQLDTFFSVTEVRDAQLVVSNIEKEFLEARRLANNMKKELTDVRVSLEEARKALDRCPRDSENFLKHVAEEHTIINKERLVRRGYEMNEQKERELFTEYSNAVRVSHEKERERAQKTKYISIIASVSGAVVGFLGSSLVTYYRMKQIKRMASPDLIINKISHEIKDNSLTKDELNKLLAANSITLVEDLSKKLNSISLKNSGYSTYNDTKALEETGKSIKIVEDEIKKILDDFAQKVAEVSQKFILDIENSKILGAKSGMAVYSDITNMNEKLNKMEGSIVDAVNKTSGNIVTETNRTLKKELSKIENRQKQLKETLTNGNMVTGGASTEVDWDVKSWTTWCPEPNLAISLFSFGLLIFLVFNKS